MAYCGGVLILQSLTTTPLPHLPQVALPCGPTPDCEQSLFFFRFSESNALSRERRSRETRETRAAAREEKRDCLSFFVPLPSRAISHARGHLRVSRFARRATEKRETARSLAPKHPLPFHCFPKNNEVGCPACWDLCSSKRGVGRAKPATFLV